MEEITVKIDGQEHIVQVEELEDGKLRVFFEGSAFEVETREDIVEELTEEISGKTSSKTGKITSPLPGTIVDITTKVGDKVKEGDTIVKLVAMKMENDIIASKDGTVKEIRVKKNQNVAKGDILVIID